MTKMFMPLLAALSIATLALPASAADNNVNQSGPVSYEVKTLYSSVAEDGYMFNEGHYEKTVVVPVRTANATVSSVRSEQSSTAKPGYYFSDGGYVHQ